MVDHSADPVRSIRRRYRGHTLILETEFETESGSVLLVDCMTPRDEVPQAVRMVVGKRGQVRMKVELVIRFDYGSVVPWVRKTERGITAMAGPDKLTLMYRCAAAGRGLQDCRRLRRVALHRIGRGQSQPSQWNIRIYRVDVVAVEQLSVFRRSLRTITLEKVCLAAD